MNLSFVKMNGLGNSFILMTDMDDEVSGKLDIHRLAKAVCDVNFGIGADGLILVKASANQDFRMVIINEDGSEAEMCGNGMRCFVKYLVERGISTASSFSVETLAGTISATVKEGDLVEVNMGVPIFENGDVVGEKQGDTVGVRVDDRAYTYISMGNPHAITFVDDFNFDWRAVGRQVEKETSVFPNHTNVEFVKVESSSEMTMKVWERGCGETQACGTGTCALVVAGVHEQKVSPGEVLVHLPGGDLTIHYKKGGPVLMTGPAVTVCSGTYSYDESK
ncbi:MAG: diaminopimelate epimerase [Deltaproteobacteria bacterium]|nr:diaminopimelate epimerase [Deltaproteobacteria bacterium]MBN2673563.1 diaminopimelate epimerase [Deltaproteobacteria bacterium]